MIIKNFWFIKFDKKFIIYDLLNFKFLKVASNLGRFLVKYHWFWLKNSNLCRVWKEHYLAVWKEHYLAQSTILNTSKSSTDFDVFSTDFTDLLFFSIFLKNCRRQLPTLVQKLMNDLNKWLFSQAKNNWFEKCWLLNFWTGIFSAEFNFIYIFWIFKIFG